ncbi:hypothetical protein LCGC14_0691370 [marine sediment metagenome]|uniref:Tyr recombinase domain-containing protein n=1 Tax=marine sediment metagenome TaxID=412755 RepID=A0A0F9QQ70_9ZZZZ
MRVYKQIHTRIIPEGAKKFTRRGKQFAKYKDRQGHTVEHRVTQDGKRLLKESEYWYIEFEFNKHRRIKTFTHREPAEQLAEIIKTKINLCPLTDTQEQFIENTPSGIKDELISFGILDAQTLVTFKTLSGHIEDFKDNMTKRERAAKHITATVASLKRLFDGCGFTQWKDISGEKIIDWLTEKRDGGKGISKRTFNGYIKTAKHFCKWLAKQLKTTSPIIHLDGLENEATDKRHTRRAATPDEIRRLLETTRQGPQRFGLTGYERSLLYLLAVETGLRANEIRTLTVGSFNFTDGIVTVEAGYSKHRRQDIVPFRTGLASELQRYFANKLPAARVFYVTDKTCDMIQADLAEAGIPYVDDNGGHFDFHALRHTFITNLKHAPARIQQALARHQSSAMTDRYTHISLHDERSAIEDLPDMTAASEQQQVMTGTDDKPVDAIGEKVLNRCCQADHKRTDMESDGKKTTLTMQKTPLGGTNKGIVKTLNQQVEGSNPSSLSQKRGFSEKQAECLSKRCYHTTPIQHLDPLLKRLASAWPKFSDEGKHIVEKLIEMAEG